MKFGTVGHEIEIPPLILAWSALGCVLSGLGLFGLRAPSIAFSLFGKLPWGLQTVSWVALIAGALICAVCIAKFVALYLHELADNQT